MTDASLITLGTCLTLEKLDLNGIAKQAILRSFCVACMPFWMIRASCIRLRIGVRTDRWAVEYTVPICIILDLLHSLFCVSILELLIWAFGIFRHSSEQEHPTLPVSQEKHYLIMVPFTLCAFTVGLDLVNQSLSTLTAAPMAMTAIQAGFMFAATMLWTIGCHVYMLIGRFRGNEQVQQPPLVKSRSGERSPSRVPSELTLCLGMLSCQIVLLISFVHNWWIYNNGTCCKAKLNFHIYFTMQNSRCCRQPSGILCPAPPKRRYSLVGRPQLFGLLPIS